MRLISHKDRDFSRMLVELNRQAEPRAEVRETVAEVITAVRKKGDTALLGYSV